MKALVYVPPNTTTGIDDCSAILAMILRHTFNRAICHDTVAYPIHRNLCFRVMWQLAISADITLVL